jgi:hypothetical protein
MPVTIPISPHPPVAGKEKRHECHLKLFLDSIKNEHGADKLGKILQGSLTSEMLQHDDTHIWYPELAFADAMYASIILAYTENRNLALRPDEVWFAILNQLGFYVHANAGQLGELFQPQVEDLVFDLKDPSPVAERLVNRLQINIVDQKLREWIAPTFSTTREQTDSVVAHMHMCAPLYWGALRNTPASYESPIGIPRRWDFGIPSVTLLGDVEDWRCIQGRILELHTFFKGEPEGFAKLLKPILHHFVESFTNPTSDAVRHFWSEMIHTHKHAAQWAQTKDTADDSNAEDNAWEFNIYGAEKRRKLGLSGWITGFTVWDAKGRLIEKREKHHITLDDVRYDRMHAPSRSSAHASLRVNVRDGEDGPLRPAIFFASPAAISENRGGQVIDESTGASVLDPFEARSEWWLLEETKDEGEAKGMNE